MAEERRTWLQRHLWQTHLLIALVWLGLFILNTSKFSSSDNDVVDVILVVLPALLVVGYSALSIHFLRQRRNEATNSSATPEDEASS